jgi:hypothetical protein
VIRACAEHRGSTRGTRGRYSAVRHYIDKTVQAFTEQVGTVSKSLTETMLAAIGTVILAVVAGLIKEEAGGVIFGSALIAYALYVLGFQLMYSLPNHQDRRRTLVDDFNYRRQRFTERIYGENVEHIVGNRIANADALFTQWFDHARRIFIGVVIAMVLVGSAFVVIGWPSFARSSPAPLSAVVPAPSPSP